MGKITYRPKAHTGKNSKSNKSSEQQINLENDKRVINKLGHIKPIGDLECDYHIYIEDYVYTYLYQYALSDLSIESSAVFIGQHYAESKEVLIRGIIPITMSELTQDSEWIDENILEVIEQERAEYFKNDHIIGWMHMQPGYGTMLTMKELREHKKVFGNTESIFMLVDAVNKIETFFVLENEELREQSGYYMYYERNEEMQRYMLDHPFVKKEAQVVEDTVVNQFREIGKLRKNEYIQRKSVNMVVIMASVILIALTAIIVKMNENKSVQAVQATPINGISNQDNEIEFIIQRNELSLGEQAQALGDTTEFIESVAEEVVEEDIQQSVENASKEETRLGQISYEEYIVKEGDTLANISYSKYGNSAMSREIAKINELGNTNYIRVGQTLKLPQV